MPRYIDAETACMYMPFSEAYVAAHFLKGVPTADVQPIIHAKWISRIYYRPSTMNYDIHMKVCSNCQYEYSYDAETGLTDMNFCPNCGAKMDLKENEDG